MQDKIDRLRRSIKKYDVKISQLKEIDRLLKEYTGFHAKKNGKNSKEQNLATSIFIKYAYDINIDSQYINEYMKYKDSHTISNNRRKFSRSFSANPDNYKAWVGFREYISYK